LNNNKNALALMFAINNIAYLPSSITTVNFYVLKFLLKFTCFGFKTVPT